MTSLVVEELEIVGPMNSRYAEILSPDACRFVVGLVRKFGARREQLLARRKERQIEIDAGPVGETTADRVTQLINKTNQFNLTTRRHSRTQVQTMLESTGSIALALRLRDKFGDQGIIAVLLAVRGGDAATLVIDSFLMSCRALGRGVEDALWAAMLRRVDRQSVQRLQAEYIPTAKNNIVAGLYDRLGLQRMEHNSSSTRYLLEPVTSVEFPSWIALKNETHE